MTTIKISDAAKLAIKEMRGGTFYIWKKRHMLGTPSSFRDVAFYLNRIINDKNLKDPVQKLLIVLSCVKLFMLRYEKETANQFYRSLERAGAAESVGQLISMYGMTETGVIETSDTLQRQMNTVGIDTRIEETPIGKDVFPKKFRVFYLKDFPCAVIYYEI